MHFVIWKLSYKAIRKIIFLPDKKILQNRDSLNRNPIVYIVIPTKILEVNQILGGPPHITLVTSVPNIIAKRGIFFFLFFFLIIISNQLFYINFLLKIYFKEYEMEIVWWTKL